MSAPSHISPVGPPSPEGNGQSDAAQEAIELTPEQEWYEEEVEAPPLRRLSDILVPAAAFLTIAAWTAFYLWPRVTEMSVTRDPQLWSSWLIEWCVPVLLVLATVLLFFRSPRREAARFGDVALSMREEAAVLERRLANVNNELSLAREFLAAQSRDLDSLGRMAGERLSTHADRIAALIGENGQQVDGIAQVSQTALDNMERLRGQLPVIAGSAKDVVNNIGNAGRTAVAQVNEMIAGFNRLNEFGQASERQVGLLQSQISDALSAFERQAEALHDIAARRFATLGTDSDAFRQQLDQHEVEALASVRLRAETLREEVDRIAQAIAIEQAEAISAMTRRLGELRDESGALSITLGRTGDETLTHWRSNLQEIEVTARDLWARLGDTGAHHARSLAEQGDVVRTSLSVLQADLASQAELTHARLSEQQALQEQAANALVSEVERLSNKLDAFTRRVADMDVTSRDMGAALDQALAQLNGQLLDSRTALEGTGRQVADLTDGSVRLLELIRAASQHTEDNLPKALIGAEERLSLIEGRVGEIRQNLDVASKQGSSLSQEVSAARETLGQALTELADAQGTLAAQTGDQQARLAGLAEVLASARSESEALASHSEGVLRVAVERLAEATRQGAGQAAAQAEETINAIAGRLGNAGSNALEIAMQGRTDEIAGQLNSAVEAAVARSREATVQLREQLARVDELTGHLERRVAEARSRAEDQVDHGLARRVTMLTEALNSTSIDLTKLFASEISDSAWQAYLKGDRGIFTRRVVRLLDSTEAREVARKYSDDDEFREYVNRYVHDFEAMLRGVLTTPDGNALAVTLLSSDMGKLYVALAQATERLRS